MLGALLDTLSAAMRARPTVRLERGPQLMDFAAWSVAAESAAPPPWPPGEFRDSHTQNRDAGHEQALDATTIGPVLLAFLRPGQSDTRLFWEGTATNLLKVLCELAASTHPEGERP